MKRAFTRKTFGGNDGETPGERAGQGRRTGRQPQGEAAGTGASAQGSPSFEPDRDEEAYGASGLPAAEPNAAGPIAGSAAGITREAGVGSAPGGNMPAWPRSCFRLGYAGRRRNRRTGRGPEGRRCQRQGSGQRRGRQWVFRSAASLGDDHPGSLHHPFVCGRAGVMVQLAQRAGQRSGRLPLPQSQHSGIAGAHAGDD